MTEITTTMGKLLYAAAAATSLEDSASINISCGAAAIALEGRNRKNASRVDAVVRLGYFNKFDTIFVSNSKYMVALGIEQPEDDSEYNWFVAPFHAGGRVVEAARLLNPRIGERVGKAETAFVRRPNIALWLGEGNYLTVPELNELGWKIEDSEYGVFSRKSRRGDAREIIRIKGKIDHLGNNEVRVETSFLCEKEDWGGVEYALSHGAIACKVTGETRIFVYSGNTYPLIEGVNPYDTVKMDQVGEEGGEVRPYMKAIEAHFGGIDDFAEMFGRWCAKITLDGKVINKWEEDEDMDEEFLGASTLSKLMALSFDE